MMRGRKVWFLLTMGRTKIVGIRPLRKLQKDRTFVYFRHVLRSAISGAAFTAPTHGPATPRSLP